MPRGDKSSYTNRQKRQAEHIEEGYETQGTPKKEAQRRAWATVNSRSGGGEKGGSGSRAREKSASSRAANSRAGKKGGRATRGVARSK